MSELRMTVDRIKEIQSETAHPNSTSVQQALFKVWNEVAQQSKSAKGLVADSVLDLLAVIHSDGGHFTSEKGEIVSIIEAKKVVLELMQFKRNQSINIEQPLNSRGEFVKETSANKSPNPLHVSEIGKEKEDSFLCYNEFRGSWKCDSECKGCKNIRLKGENEDSVIPEYRQEVDGTRTYLNEDSLTDEPTVEQLELQIEKYSLNDYRDEDDIRHIEFTDNGLRLFLKEREESIQREAK